jgi:type IV pilus assembly protein PilM
MNSFLTSLKKRFRELLLPREMVGLDLGRGCTKLVYLQRDKEGEVSKVVRELFPESLLEMEGSAVDRFQVFLSERHLVGKPVACNLDDSSLKIRRLDLPQMPDFDLKEAVKWQLRDLIEDAIEKYSVRFSILDRYDLLGTKKNSVLAYAVHTDLVEKMQDLLKRLSLKPYAVTPASVALLSAYDRILQWKPDVVYGILDFGEASSRFLAISNRRLLFSRPIPDISLSSLFRMISEEMALPPQELQALKGQWIKSREGESVEERFLPVLSAFFSRISIEIQRSLDAFTLVMHEKEKVDRFFLNGGGSVLPGIGDFINKNVGIPAEHLDPFEGWTVPGNHHHLFFVATGLALFGT